METAITKMRLIETQAEADHLLSLGLEAIKEYLEFAYEYGDKELLRMCNFKDGEPEIYTEFKEISKEDIELFNALETIKDTAFFDLTMENLNTYVSERLFISQRPLLSRDSKSVQMYLQNYVDRFTAKLFVIMYTSCHDGKTEINYTGVRYDEDGFTEAEFNEMNEEDEEELEATHLERKIREHLNDPKVLCQKLDLVLIALSQNTKSGNTTARDLIHQVRESLNEQIIEHTTTPKE